MCQFHQESPRSAVQARGAVWSASAAFVLCLGRLHRSVRGVLAPVNAASNSWHPNPSLLGLGLPRVVELAVRWRSQHNALVSLGRLSASSSNPVNSAALRFVLVVLGNLGVSRGSTTSPRAVVLAFLNRLSNPSVNRTSNSGLRPLSAAGYLKR